MNLNRIRKIRAAHRVLFPMLAAVLALALVGGVVLAAVVATRTLPGNITIVAPTGGGGGGGTGGTIYNFNVFDSTGVVLTSVDWSLPKSGSATATVYLKNTGTGALTVDVAATLPAGMTMATVSPVSLPVSLDLVPVNLTINYGSSGLDTGISDNSTLVVFTGNS